MRTFCHHVYMAAAIVLIGHSVASAQVGACCLGGGTCIGTDQLGCDAVVGDYVGDGTTCGLAGCIAACCFADNTCSAQARDDCVALSGTYQGPGTTCELHCAAPLPTIFTYQGQLKELGRPVDGMIDIQLSLWTTAKGGDQVGTTLALFDIVVKNGLFSVPVNFSAALFDGNNRWLEVDIRSPAWDGVGVEPMYTTLSPRQLVTYAPQSLQTRGLFVDDAGQVAMGHTSPTALLHLKGANNPTIKIQANDTSEKSGRLSLRSVNNNGMDMYYDISAAPAITFESVFNDVPALKLMKINRSLTGSQDRVEIAGRLRLRSFDLEAQGMYTSLVIGHDLATADAIVPSNMLIELAKSDGLESLARIEFNGNVDPLAHQGDLRFYTRSVADTDIVERLRITEAGEVGIGTTTPNDALEVVGRIRSSGANGGAITAYDPNNQRSSLSLSWLNDVARIRVGGSGTAAKNGLDIQTKSDKSLMRLLHSGNVGIGTSSPQSLLQVGVGDESSFRLGLNPQMIIARDVANKKFRVQLTGTGYLGKVLQLGRDDGTHDIVLSGDVKATKQIHSINASGSTRVKMGLSDFGDYGNFQTYNAAGTKIVEINHTGLTTNAVAGAISVYGPKSLNFQIGTNGILTDHGFMAVYDANGFPRAGMVVDAAGQGLIFGGSKSFRVTNPRDPSTDIWYASLEGPEAAAYYRGTAKLVDGRAAISIPEHFSDVCSHSSLTVHLTPKSAASKGLAFTGIQNSQVVVEELMGGKGTYEFDYLLIDVRAGYEKFKVIRPALELDPGAALGVVNSALSKPSPVEAKIATSPTTSLARNGGTGKSGLTNPFSSGQQQADAASLLARVERLEEILARQSNQPGSEKQ